MRIVFLQDQLRVGGTERQTLLLARLIQERGHEVQLLTFRPGGELAGEPERLGLRQRVLQGFDSGVSVWAPGIRQAVEEAAPDVAVCMGRSANLYAGALQEACPQVCVVATVRTGKELLPQQWRALRRVRGILVNSEWWQRELLTAGFPSERVSLVHNPVPLSARPDPAVRNEVRARLAAPAGVPVLLQVGTFRRHKGQADLISALALLADRRPELPWQLWFVGKGIWRHLCQRRASRHRLSERIRFLGYQGDPAPYYAGADLAVSLSREESLPNFLLEAQGAGLPVVATACRGVEECVRSERTGYVVPAGDRHSFLERLEHLLRDPAERQRLGQAARPWIAEAFDPDRLVDQLLASLERWRR